MKKLLIVAILALICSNIDAKLAIRQPCSDGMVLQQQASAVVWGWADPGAAVTVTPSWNGRSVQARADAGGLWKAYVNTPTASYKSYSIRGKSGAESLTIKERAGGRQACLPRTEQRLRVQQDSLLQS